MNRMDTKRRAAIIAALVEGVGIRATCRLTGASKGAVTKLIADLGQVLEAFLDEKLASLPCRVLECDEVWSFVAKKQKRVEPHEIGSGVGDTWTFTATCADTKLIPTWLVAPRDAASAERFLIDLASRVRDRVQVTTDGQIMLVDAMDTAFGGNVDYSMLIKLYGAPQEGQKSYSPAECIGAKRARVQGTPDPARVSTSYVERSNLSIRMDLRRMARLTNGHSKKIENHCTSLAIYFAHYNLCRPHQALGKKRTPAMAAGLADRVWTIEDLIRVLEGVEAGGELLGESRRER